MSQAREIFKSSILENAQKRKKEAQQKKQGLLISNTDSIIVRNPVIVPFLCPFDGQFKAILVKTSQDVTLSINVNGEKVYDKLVKDTSLIRPDIPLKFADSVELVFSGSPHEHIEMSYNYIYEADLNV